MKKLVLMLSLCLGVFFSCNTEEIASNGDNEVQELNIQLQDYVQTSGQNRSYEPPVCDCPFGETCEIFEITYDSSMSLGQIAQLRQFYFETLLCGVCMWTTQPFDPYMDYWIVTNTSCTDGSADVEVTVNKDPRGARAESQGDGG